MNWLDWVRYVLALLLVVTGPGSVLFWFPVHPLAAYWRLVGWRWGYVIGYSTFIGSAAVMAALSPRLLSVDYG